MTTHSNFWRWYYLLPLDFSTILGLLNVLQLLFKVSYFLVRSSDLFENLFEQGCSISWTKCSQIYSLMCIDSMCLTMDIVASSVAIISMVWHQHWIFLHCAVLTAVSIANTWTRRSCWRAGGSWCTAPLSQSRTASRRHGRRSWKAWTVPITIIPARKLIHQIFGRHWWFMRNSPWPCWTWEYW